MEKKGIVNKWRSILINVLQERVWLGFNKFMEAQGKDGFLFKILQRSLVTINSKLEILAVLIWQPTDIRILYRTKHTHINNSSYRFLTPFAGHPVFVWDKVHINWTLPHHGFVAALNTADPRRAT